MTEQQKHPAESQYVFEPSAIPSLPVKGEAGLFPVHRIYCIGRNYAAHAIEMGHNPDKEPPFFFQKNADNVMTDKQFEYPSQTSDVHHEVELVVALSKGGKNISIEDALGCVYGYGVGIDMTRRDLQSEAKKLGRPWEIAKAFENSAPCSELVKASESGHPSQGAIVLKVNGEVRQEGNLNQMIWKVAEQISILSEFFELQRGDLIMTGTPSGVGQVGRGDQMEAHVEGVGSLSVKVV